MPKFAKNYHDLGLVYRAQERFDPAVEQFEKALALKPSHSGALFNLGMTYAAAGKRARALKYLKLYTMRRTSSEDALRVRAAEKMITKLRSEAARKK